MLVGRGFSWRVRFLLFLQFVLKFLLLFFLQQLSEVTFIWNELFSPGDYVY
jgi:hypothetical protein